MSMTPAIMATPQGDIVASVNTGTIREPRELTEDDNKKVIQLRDSPDQRINRFRGLVVTLTIIIILIVSVYRQINSVHHGTTIIYIIPLTIT